MANSVTRGSSAKCAAYLLGGAVGRAVVDDDDLELRIVARQNVAHRADDDLPLVKRRDEHCLQRRMLRELRWHARASRAGCASPTRSETGRGPRRANGEKEHCDKAAEPAQRHEDRQADQLRGARRQRRHRLIAREARELRHRHEVVALRPQAIDQLRQRRDGLRAISAGIVQQDDVAADSGFGSLTCSIAR